MRESDEQIIASIKAINIVPEATIPRKLMLFKSRTSDPRSIAIVMTTEKTWVQTAPFEIVFKATDPATEWRLNNRVMVCSLIKFVKIDD